MVGVNIIHCYSGKWYNLSQAHKVEEKLRNESGTGESWSWKDKKGNQVIFS